MGITRERIELIKQNEEEMFNLYVKLGQNSFMDLLGIPRGSAHRILGKDGLDWYSRSVEIKSLREELSYTNWLSLESQDTWYFLGYFLGDGSLRKKGNSYNVNISSSELQLINELSIRFGVPLNKGRNELGCWYELNIYSEKLFRWMEDLGFCVRKSFTGCYPKAPNREFIGSFLRGLLDSDGSVKFCDTSKEVSWYGHSSYMSLVKELLIQLGFKCNYGLKENLVRVSVYGISQLENLYYVLYPKDDVLKLERKYEKYTEWMISRSNISSIEETGEEIEMMDMEVEDSHQYYANGILVLNCAQEIRMTANVSNAKTWVDAILSGNDIHKATAETMYGLENYDKSLRKRAKVINFLSLYGGSPYTLSERLHLPLEECEDAMAKWWKALPEIQNYQKVQLRMGKKTGTQYNIFGFPRRVGYYLNNEDAKKRAFGKRTIGNNNIQSGCASLTQASLIKVCKETYENPEWKDDCEFFTFIHDEIQSSVKSERMLEFIPICRWCMTKVFPNLPVPFETSCAIGPRLGCEFEMLYGSDGNSLVPDVEWDDKIAEEMNVSREEYENINEVPMTLTDSKYDIRNILKNVKWKGAKKEWWDSICSR